MKKINEKQYSEAKRAQSIACMDYNELSDCHCTTLTTENARLEAKVGELEEIRRAYQNIVIYESKIKERYTEENNQIWILDGTQMEDEEVKQLIELIDILEEKLEALKGGA